ncbi:hypothetical protein Fmac_008445 [Flemingia macrophylla]|uniref:Uncharacterized protein n=1 Tax=Flemingia macrophylla TaxID=520843 RepID=A0ABD1MZU0_9FABA
MESKLIRCDAPVRRRALCPLNSLLVGARMVRILIDEGVMVGRKQFLGTWLPLANPCNKGSELNCFSDLSWLRGPQGGPIIGTQFLAVLSQRKLMFRPNFGLEIPVITLSDGFRQRSVGSEGLYHDRSYITQSLWIIHSCPRSSRRSSPRRRTAPCLDAAPRLASLPHRLGVEPSRCTSPPRPVSPRSPPRPHPPRPRLAAISPHPPNGGASGMLTTCVIQPIDMIKVMSSSHLFVLIPPNGILGLSDFRCGIQIYSFCVRIQLGQGSAAQVTTTMLKNEGVAAFYKATYTTARLGSFKFLTSKAIEDNDGKPLPLYQKALCGLTDGAIGATASSPTDLALIQMQADATLPAAQRRNYTNAFHALYQIVADEGVLVLWKGVGPTVVRAMALNMGMLASYDQSVEFFRDSVGLGEAATVLGGVGGTYSLFASTCISVGGYAIWLLQCLSRYVQVRYLDFLQQLAVCHLTMPRPRFRRCSQMLRENIHTLALWIVLSKPSKLEDHSNSTLDSPSHRVKIAPHVMVLFYLFLSYPVYFYDIDLPEPNSEIAEKLWIVVLHGNGHFSVEFKL